MNDQKSLESKIPTIDLEFPVTLNQTRSLLSSEYNLKNPPAVSLARLVLAAEGKSADRVRTKITIPLRNSDIILGNYEARVTYPDMVYDIKHSIIAPIELLLDCVKETVIFYYPTARDVSMKKGCVIMKTEDFMGPACVWPLQKGGIKFNWECKFSAPCVDGNLAEHKFSINGHEKFDWYTGSKIGDNRPETLTTTSFAIDRLTIDNGVFLGEKVGVSASLEMSNESLYTLYTLAQILVQSYGYTQKQIQINDQPASVFVNKVMGRYISDKNDFVRQVFGLANYNPQLPLEVYNQIMSVRQLNGIRKEDFAELDSLFWKEFSKNAQNPLAT
jgi:hypothetical protein